MAKKTARPRGSGKTDRTIIYRGIKIAPISGRRSEIAEAIRDALRKKSGQSPVKPADI